MLYSTWQEYSKFFHAGKINERVFARVLQRFFVELRKTRVLNVQIDQMVDWVGYTPYVQNWIKSSRNDIPS